MKQIFQIMGTGEIGLGEFPAPQARPGHLLIRSTASLISAGTERSLVEFGRASLVSKAWQRPEKVIQTLERVRTDGLLATLDAVRDKLHEYKPMGYCNSGRVVEIGEGAAGFKVGDRVASNGPHAELVCAPKNLCAKVPDNVSDDDAAFTVIAAVALQGIRLALPTLGECFVVFGLGLIGLITVQLLKAAGCRVLGVDPNRARLDMAERFGARTLDIENAEDTVAAALSFSEGRGVDGVILTAHTPSNEPIHQSAIMSRKRGRIVLVGQTGLNLSREDFYEKELSFQVSCSYGPGRYDPVYEEQGHDYPLGFVRWTEQRNFEAALSMLSERKLDVAAMISHRFPFDRAIEAYELLERGDASLGIVLQYPRGDDKADKQVLKRTITLAGPEPSQAESGALYQRRDPALPVIGVIGSGEHAFRLLLPALKQSGARLKTVASRGGFTAAQAARRFGFAQATTDTESVLSDPEINVVFVITRHDSHARYVLAALNAGKSVFVEKPLAITSEELEHVKDAYGSLLKTGHAPLLTVGFNRRFAPHIRKMKELLRGLTEPKAIIMTVNAGPIPADHWIQDPRIGGGRIIGEGCHFVDLLRFLADSPVKSVQVTRMGNVPGMDVTEDKTTFTLSFADGSLGTVHYLANGNKSFPKERLEVFCQGRILQLDNFRTLRGYGGPGFKKMRLWKQDKGHHACVFAFLNALREGKPAPIPFEELIEVSRVTLQVANTSALS